MYYNTMRKALETDVFLVDDESYGLTWVNCV